MWQTQNGLLKMCRTLRQTKSLALSILLTLITYQSALAATQVTRSGITWTFNSDYQVGQFANGDWWVLDTGAGVRVNSVSPAPTGSGSSFRNGSVLNPTGPSTQGYDGRVSGYSSSLSKSYPLTLTAGDSLVSAGSKTSGASSNDIMGTSINPEHGYLQRASVLTVVSSVPNPNSFRPPYVGNNKPIYLTTSLQRELLLGLPLNSKPSLTYLNEVANYFENVWLDHKVGWECRMMHPLSNMPNYGREIGMATSRASTLLMLDYTQEQLEPLLINFVQLGIDLYAMSQTGTSWYGDGGHANGRKWPILFAGIMLDDNNMKSVNVSFGEDNQTYYGVTPSANPGQNYVAYWGRNCSSPYQGNGCSGNGTKDCRPSSLNADGCQDYRNCCTSYTWVGEALAVQLMNQAGLWNHSSFFDYVDRWMGYGNDPQVASGGYVDPGSAGDSFIVGMWNTYRPLIDSGQPTNNRPVANAGQDQTIVDVDGNGSEQVTLDGSASTDSDGTVTSYVWTENTNQIATGVNPTVAMNTGQHTITLTVTDDGGLTDTDTVIITVNSEDKIPPSVVSILCSQNSLEITFNEPLDSISAENINNYQIDNTISITQASYNTNTQKVILTTSDHIEHNTYTVTARDISDTDGNKMLVTTKSYTYSPGLVGYWEFDQDSGLEAEDLSGKNNTATLINGPAWTGQGELSFDGIDDAAQISTTDWNANSGSIALRAYMGNSSDVGYLFGHTIGSWSNRIQLYTENGNLGLGLGDSHSLNTNITAVNLQTWYHITLTWDQGSYVVYINGAEKAAGQYSGLTSLGALADIGNDGNPSFRNESLNSLVDKVRVYNRALTAEQVLDLFNIDQPLAFSQIGDKEVDENSNLNFTIETIDSNIIVSIQDHNLPSPPSFTDNTFNWTPTYDDAGRYDTTFIAENGLLEDFETITITVNNVNRNPALGAIGDKSVDENSILTFSVYASDPDGDSVSYTTGGLPSGATFTGNIFEWTPGYDQAGTYPVSFTASDGELSDIENITITVNDTSNPGQEIVIIDNGSNETSQTGVWGNSGALDPYGIDSLWSRNGSTYTWTFSPAISGYYDLSMWWSGWPSRNNNIPVDIEHADGITRVYINQLQNFGQWNSLAAFNFLSGQSYNVTITSQPEPTSTCADAVKFTLLGQQPDTIIDGTEGFTYVDDPFRNTSQPNYADGSRLLPDTLQVILGGVDRAKIYGMSGGWQQDFTLTSDSNVTLTLSYNLTQTQYYERDEFSDFMVAISNTLFGTAGQDYLIRIIGDGNNGGLKTTGNQQLQIDHYLPAGTHTLIIGAYNNKKTHYNEATRLLINNVVLKAQ